MLIDGHAHACGGYLRPADIIRTLDENELDKVVLVPGQLNSTRTYGLPDIASVFPESDLIPYLNRMIGLSTALSGDAKTIPEGNCYVQSLVRACPDHVIQFYWALLQRPGILNEIERDYEDWGFKGLKLHQVWERFDLGSPAFEAVAGFATEKNLPIFIHLRSKRDVRKHIAFMRRHPETCFIIGHLFGLAEYIESGVAMGNTYFDISAPPFVSRHRVIQAIEHFGADRIILGSDSPYGKHNLRDNVRRIREMSLSDYDRQLILGGNLQRLLNL